LHNEFLGFQYVSRQASFEIIFTLVYSPPFFGYQNNKQVILAKANDVANHFFEL